MSQLLWGTLLLGLLVLACVGLYTWWDMRRARKKLIGMLPKSEYPRGAETTYIIKQQGGYSHDAAAIEETRIEPRLYGDAEHPASANALEIPAYERLRGRQSPPLQVAEASGNAYVATDNASTQVDTNAGADFDEAGIASTAFIEFNNPMSGYVILQYLPRTRRAGNKPVDVQAFVDGNDTWEEPNPQTSYRTLRLSVLLANRQGPLNELDYSEFVNMVQGLAEATGGDAEFDDMQDAVKRARKLDEFAAGHDALITLSLRARGAPWSVNFLVQCALSQGFVPGKLPGRLVKLHHGGEVMIALQFDPQVALASTSDSASKQALTHAELVLDVPQVPQQYTPLAVMKDDANALARVLDAAVADEQGRTLSDETWLNLSAQISTLYQSLESKGLAAGKPAALKVYS